MRVEKNKNWVDFRSAVGRLCRCHFWVENFLRLKWSHKNDDNKSSFKPNADFMLINIPARHLLFCVRCLYNSARMFRVSIIGTSTAITTFKIFRRTFHVTRVCVAWYQINSGNVIEHLLSHFELLMCLNYQ